MRRQRLFRRILACLPATALVPAVIAALSPSAAAYEPSYRMTPAGALEIKTLPAAKTIEAPIDMRFFPLSAGPAMKILLDYASNCGLKVKTPAILSYDAAKIRLYAEETGIALPAAAIDPQTSANKVSISRLPERTVASFGMSGRYNRENFELGKRRLAGWLAAHPEWRASDAPYVVYWDGPYVPAMKKHAEVHLPITRNITALAGKAGDYAP